MICTRMRLLLTTCLAPFTAADAQATRLQLDPGHPFALQRAQFVVRELQRLSDTGIYRTLTLKSILGAATSGGVFHHNTFLRLELASPFFSSGRNEESFEVIVLEHRDDGHVSFAIDTFPDMDAGAMEDFHTQKVQQQRQTRNALFTRLDSEVEGRNRAWNAIGTANSAEMAVKLVMETTDNTETFAQGSAQS